MAAGSLDDGRYTGMQTSNRFLVLLAAASLAAPLSAGAQLHPAQPADGAMLLLAQGDCPSLSDAVERVRRQYQGRIVSAETERRGKREVHVIKVLTDDGKVKTVRIQGCSSASRG
ncbi:MAG TPA: hypothetical protein VFE85_00510 [Woeseiaceae bacterium]|nr:hypothetical protein [Woeseiaceae bacterium]